MLPFSSKHKKWRIFVSSLILSLLFSLNCSPLGNTSVQAAPNKFDENQIRAIFLFNLTNFVYWPENCFSSQESPFIITILQDDHFGDYLEEIVKNEKVALHPIVVKKIASLEQLKKTHMLYIPRDYKKRLLAIATVQSAQNGVLTVSNYPGFTESGGAVNLLIRNKRLVLELNVVAAKKNHLKFSSKLLRLAKIVGRQ